MKGFLVRNNTKIKKNKEVIYCYLKSVGTTYILDHFSFPTEGL